MFSTFNFSVFYHAVVKDHSSLNQYDAVNVLLIGKTAEDAQVNAIDNTLCSRYVYGKKPIPKRILKDLYTLELDKVVPRLSVLGIQDISFSVNALRSLFTTYDMGFSEAERSRLLEVLAGDDAIAALAEIFIAAVRCNPKDIQPLTDEEAQIASSGIIPNDTATLTNTTDNTDVSVMASDSKNDPGNIDDDSANETTAISTSSTDPNSSFTETPCESLTNPNTLSAEAEALLFSDSCFKWRPLIYSETPSDELLDTLIDYFECNSDQVITIDGADIKAILPLSPDEFGYLIQITGDYKWIEKAVSSSGFIRNADGVLLTMCISPDISLEEIMSLSNIISDKIKSDAKMIWGVSFSPDKTDIWTIKMLINKKSKASF